MTYFLGLAEPLLKIIDACKDKDLNLSPEASRFRALVKIKMIHGSFELDVKPEENDGLDKLENDMMEEVSRRVKEQKVDLDKEQAEKENIRYLELKKIHKENREIRKIIREREKINAYKSKNPFFRCLSWLGILGPDRNKIKIGRSEETYYKVFNALETEREEKLRLATIASKREVLLKAVEEEKAHRRAEYLEHVATVEQALARAEEKIKSQEALIKNQDNNLKNVLEESKHYKSLSEQKSLRMNELEKIAREERERDAFAVERVQKAQEEAKEAVEKSRKWEGIVKKKQHEIDMLLDSSQKASSALKVATERAEKEEEEAEEAVKKSIKCLGIAKKKQHEIDMLLYSSQKASSALKVATERAEKAEKAAQLMHKLSEQESFDRKREGERAQSEIKALLEKVQKAQAPAPVCLVEEGSSRTSGPSVVSVAKLGVDRKTMSSLKDLNKIVYTSEESLLIKKTEKNRIRVLEKMYEDMKNKGTHMRPVLKDCYTKFFKLAEVDLKTASRIVEMDCKGKLKLLDEMLLGRRDDYMDNSCLKGLQGQDLFVTVRERDKISKIKKWEESQEPLLELFVERAKNFVYCFTLIEVGENAEAIAKWKPFQEALINYHDPIVGCLLIKKAIE